MSFKSLGNPFDGNSDLTHGPGCSCPICVFAREEAQSEYECSETEMTAKLERAVFENSEQPESASAMSNDAVVTAQSTDDGTVDSNTLETPEDVMDRVVESAIVRSRFGHHEPSRREFITRV